MSTTTHTSSLGPFAPAGGPPNATARTAAVAGLLSAALAAIRPAAVSAGFGDPRWMRAVSVAAGIAAILLALAGTYQVSARGQRGRGFATLGLWLGVGGALTAFVYGAARDGDIRLDRFVEAYFDREVLGAVAGDLARGAVNTVKLAFVSETLAIGVGLVLATLRLSPNPLLRYPAVAYIDVVRGMPILVLASLVAFGLPFIGISLGGFAGPVTALTINASAYVAEIFRAGIQALARGQMEAARSLGMSQGTAMVNVVIPQAVRAVIPPLMSEFIALIKDTAFVLLIFGVTVATRDIYAAAQAGASSTFSPSPFIGAAIAYLILTIPLTRLVGVAERRLRAGLA